MTRQAIETMIRAGDERKCHLHLEGDRHFFKFGSYWVEATEEERLAVRVYDPALVRRLNELLRAVHTKKLKGMPELEAHFECPSCDWSGPREKIPRFDERAGVGLCPICASLVKQADQENW